MKNIQIGISAIAAAIALIGCGQQGRAAAAPAPK